MTKRLTAKSLAAWRTATLAEQDGNCAVCGMPITAGDPAVGDHDHGSGKMRGVLHRSCNSMLGKLENARARYGMKAELHFHRFLRGVTAYLAAAARADDAPYYPTYKTADEKRELRNKRARAARAAMKKGI